MFNQYPHKVKFKALLVIFAFLSIAAYKRSFSTLIALIRENKNLTEKRQTVKNNFQSVKQLNAELNAIDRIIGKEGIDKEKIQQNIIDFVTRHGNGISIFNLQAIHEFTNENYKVYTNQLDITGNLNQLMALSYRFEKEFSDSRLVSLDYYTIKKHNAPTVLHLKMIFQNYENNN